MKVCGVTNPEDALFAAKNGADYIGMIIWPNAKRSVNAEMAKQVAEASREGGAEPVGVFVSENAEEVMQLPRHSVPVSRRSMVFLQVCRK